MADSFTHLHVHTEYSMLDGAARIGEVVAAAAARRPAGPRDHRPREHVRDPRLLQGVPGPGHQADPRLRALHGPREPPRAPEPPGPHGRRRRRRRGRREALLPPHRAGRDERGLPEPHQAQQRGLPQRALVQAPSRLRPPRRAQRRADRHLGVPRWARAPGADARRHRGGAQGGGAAAGHLRARLVLHRDAGPRHPGAAPHQPDAPRAGRAPAGAAARHQRQPLRPPERLRRPRRAAVRADRLADERPRSLQVPRRRALPEAGPRDALPVRRDPRGVRQHALDRRAGRRHHRVRQAAAARLPAARRASTSDAEYLQHLTHGGRPPAVGERRSTTRSSSASPTSSA